MLFFSMRSSNIISDASSCFHFFPFLYQVIISNVQGKNSKMRQTYSALGMNNVSQTWLHGPWPRSWHNPASWTHETSRSVISSSGCDFCKCSDIRRARCETPKCITILSKKSKQNTEVSKQMIYTETVLKTIMRRPRPDIIGSPKLFYVSESLELSPVDEEW